MSEHPPTPIDSGTVIPKARTSRLLVVLGSAGMLWVCIGGCVLFLYAFVLFPLNASQESFNSLATNTVVAGNTTRTATSLQTPTTQAALATVTAQSRWSVALFDSFDDNENRWQTGDRSGARGTINRTITDGKYAWDINSDQGVVWTAYPNLRSLSDFSATVEVKLVNGSVDCRYGLMLRMDAGGNYYEFNVGDDQYFGFSFWNGENWKTLIRYTKSTAIRPGQVNRLTATAEGSHFSFFVNDQPVGDYDDDTIKTGRVGLAADLEAPDHATYEFDNFQVRIPTVPTPGTPTLEPQITPTTETTRTFPSSTPTVPPMQTLTTATP